MLRMRIAAMVFLLTAIAAFAYGSAGENPEPVALTSGWHYRWSDSPVDANGEFAWLTDRSDPGWNALARLEMPGGRDGQEWLWYQATLPAMAWTHPALFLPSVATSFEVYVGTDQIYQYGLLRSDPRGKYTATKVHIVLLPSGYEGQTLSLRIFSEVSFAGIDAVASPPLVGSEQDIVRHVLRRGLENTAIGVFLIFAGCFALLTYLIRLRENLLAPLTFAGFSILMGAFNVFTQHSTQWLVESPELKLYGLTLSFLFFPICMFAYLQATIFRDSGVGMRRIIWGVFWLHLVWALAATVLDLVDAVMIPVGMYTYNILFAVTVVIMLAVTIWRARLGSTEARIVAWGFAVFGMTGLLDLLQGLHVIPYLHWVSAWGALVFVGCLGYVLERDFTENQRRLKTYSVQLEEKSQQLEEYSHTLEDKVADRTRDLDEKNQQLRGTLTELKETQQQLVLREKMASLGNLVAGVAHEVNNPIGAVMSASDVSSRCVDIVRDFVNEKADEDSPKVRKAADVLADNNRITSEAARRISEIVKSLKNFARLDEAEFQRVNVHDGIDSTLTLVKHLLKGRIEVVKVYGDLPPLLVYPNQLNQVFMNLIANAIDAIDGEGTITITTRKDKLNAYISIADSGPGIPEHQLRRIFDPGFTTKGVGVGTGLGLSISYNIVHKHNGALEVESEAGKGATFTIVLPLRQITTEDPPSFS